LIIDGRFFFIQDFERGKKRRGWSGAQVVDRVRTVSAAVSLYAAFSIVSGVEAQTIARTVVAGGVLKLGHYASVNPDCSLLGMPVVRLSVAPMHGALRMFKTWDFSHFAATSLDRCNTRRVEGVSVEYRPERGFAGTDTFSLDIIYASGRE
jgi:hypothetical protein